MTDIGSNPYRTQLGRPARWLTGCWKGSRTCFMLSALVYLALPTPCDAYDSYDNYFICVPPQVGDLWAYRRTIVLGNETGIETVTVKRCRHRTSRRSGILPGIQYRHGYIQ